jgi:hypothetical protein
MNKLRVLLFLLTFSTLLFNFVAFAEDSPESDQKETKATSNLKDSSDFQKIIDEYKSYVAKIPPEVRDEVIEYRKEVAKLNKQKRILYRKLSQDSQEYLQKEQQYKKKLPLQRKNLINLEDSNQPAEDSKD